MKGGCPFPLPVNPCTHAGVGQGLTVFLWQIDAVGDTGDISPQKERRTAGIFICIHTVAMACRAFAHQKLALPDHAKRDANARPYNRLGTRVPFKNGAQMQVARQRQIAGDFAHHGRMQTTGNLIIKCDAARHPRIQCLVHSTLKIAKTDV